MGTEALVDVLAVSLVKMQWLRRVLVATENQLMLGWRSFQNTEWAVGMEHLTQWHFFDRFCSLLAMALRGWRMIR